MKSLIEESSSIAKAIEKGWERAGKPQSFSVKVFELPEKNFLGITTKYAKVGIFFAGEKPTTPPVYKKEQPAHPRPKKSQEKSPEDAPSLHSHNNQKTPRNNTPRPKQNNTPSLTHQTRSHEPSKEHGGHHAPTQELEPTIVWSQDMVNFITKWLESSLTIMQLESLTFSTTASKNHLKVHFSGPIVANHAKQIQLFRGLSYLIMASIRAQFKTDLKGLRVIFSCE